MAKKRRTLSDLIRDEVQQQSLFIVEKSCSGATFTAPAPEQKHWVEIYTGSKRKAYYYYRYVWMEGRKLHHVHIGGAAKSDRAIAMKEKVESAIALGKSPTQIIALIAIRK